jgi:ERCC4-related helicase
MFNLDNLSNHHARYLAEQLTIHRGGSGVGRIAGALHDAQVDINPHQVDAALFAFKSPFQDGVILADEVGLGKTIEAGLVMLQNWSEGKRAILVICPSSLRKQWSQELQDKFFLSSRILEGPSWKQFVGEGKPNGFDQSEIVICSYHFAAAKDDYLRRIPWDLVVLDEAHRVRNVYKKDNKIGRSLRSALSGRRKLLLTATPLQNSLMELYGLVSFVDEYAFGDERSFRMQYARITDRGTYDELKQRIRPYCHRTLRRQVTEYIQYTNRVPITQEFVPGEQEQTLYDLVSGYLQRELLQALPSGQRTLMTLVMRKLLASSTFAIAGALDSLIRKLNGQLRNDAKARTRLEQELSEDYEELEETAEEWDESPQLMSVEDREAVIAEIGELEQFRDLAVSITENAKGEALLKALETGFKKAQELGGADKVIVFTESRRTQQYLLRLLSEKGYADQIVLFNGSNSDEIGRRIYKDWSKRNAGSDRVTGSRTADTRAALVDEFRDRARIMIATEAAAEGINLQFCSMLVNYDLPWNPQRIEQRIGRCHRYGQKHDVVVINFLNKNNAADQRVFELLNEKFQLFSGVFGASDEVLGAVESGVDFEHRIVDIYQRCRSQDEIKYEFDQLQLALESAIDETMQQTRQHLLEHFDADVHARLRINSRESEEWLNQVEESLWRLTRVSLSGFADFDEQNKSFELQRTPPQLDANLCGSYRMVRYPEEGHKYRIQHPLAQWVIHHARDLPTPDAVIFIDIDAHRQAGGAMYSRVDALCGQSGWLQLEHLSFTGAMAEEHLLLVAETGDGGHLDDETAFDLLRIAGTVTDEQPGPPPESLQRAADQMVKRITGEVAQRNQQFFEEAMEKLELRAKDLKNGLETELKELDREIRGKRRESRTVGDLDSKLALHREIARLERERNTKRRNLFERQDQIDQEKEGLIDEVQRRLDQETTRSCLYRLRWTVK